MVICVTRAGNAGWTPARATLGRNDEFLTKLIGSQRKCWDDLRRLAEVGTKLWRD